MFHHHHVNKYNKIWYVTILIVKKIKMSLQNFVSPLQNVIFSTDYTVLSLSLYLFDTFLITLTLFNFKTLEYAKFYPHKQLALL